jgi:hypothetical protein
MPNLLADIELTTGQSAPASFADVLGMSAVVNVASVDSIILLIASVPIDTGPDACAEFQFAVGGVREGPGTNANVDLADLGNGLSGFTYAITGLSGSQTFSLQWQIQFGTPSLDTGKIRSFQVIEILPGDTAALLADITSVAAGSDSTGSFVNVGALSAGVTVGGTDRLILLTASVPPDIATSGDECAGFRFADGGTPEGPHILIFKDEENEGVGLSGFARAKIGISGAKTFSLQWSTEGGAAAMSLDTTRTRSFQILEITPAAAAPTAAITGTAQPTSTEPQIVAGGRTILITLTDDTWVAAGAAFNAQRQAIIDGLDSAQSEGLGWNAEVRDKEVVGAVVRTSDTLVTITLTAQPGYDITATETIEVTVPASALVTSGIPLTATPTFTVTSVAATAAITGTATATIDEDDVIAGGNTIIITLDNGSWVAAGGTFDAQRQAIIDGLDSAQVEATGWNAEVRDKEVVTAVVRTSQKVVTITLTAQAAYDITAQETITVTVPASAINEVGAIIGTPTFTVDFVVIPTTAALSGTIVPLSIESQIVAGGRTLIITLTDDTWVAAGGTFNAVRQAIIDGCTSAQSEATGWNAEVRDKQSLGQVVRTSDTVVTITWSAQAAYNITDNEIITVTVPASALVVSAIPVVATPTFKIFEVPIAIITGTVVPSVDEVDLVAGGETIIITLIDDTWLPAGVPFNDSRQEIVDEITASTTQINGWNQDIRDNIPPSNVVRTSDTVVTITLQAQASYAIVDNELVTVTVPGSALAETDNDIVGIPTFNTIATVAAAGSKARDRRGGKHAEDIFDVNTPDVETFPVNKFD